MGAVALCIFDDVQLGKCALPLLDSPGSEAVIEQLHDDLNGGGDGCGASDKNEGDIWDLACKVYDGYTHTERGDDAVCHRKTRLSVT